jgi:hypothetical protein
VTNEEMALSNNAVSPDTVAELGAENGGGMMATLEMFHHLHCLVGDLGSIMHHAGSNFVLEFTAKMDFR